MTVTYRTAGAWGAGKGANLTAAEVDSNFWDHEGRIDTLESTPPAPNNIDDITVSGSQMTITMEDASTFGPFTLPTARWRWRGDFTDATVYAVEDFFADPDTSSIYRTLIGHTSATPFDPDLLSSGDPVYELILDASGFGGGGIAGIVTKTGVDIDPILSEAGYVFRSTYFNAGNFQIGADRVQVDLPTNATVAFEIGTQLWFIAEGNQMLFFQTGGSIIYPNNFGPRSRTYGSVIRATKIGTDKWVIDGDLEAENPVITVSGTTHTLRHDQIAGYHRCTNASGCDVEVPLNTDVVIPTGAEFHFRQCGAADVTMVAATGVTINAKSGSTLSTAEVGSVITIKKIGTNEWDLFGDDA